MPRILKGRAGASFPGRSSHYQISENDPWYQITFVRLDRGARNEFGTAAARSLWSCKLDGTLVRRLTYNLSSDFDPTIMWDDRLLYATWQRRNLDHGTAGRISLFGVNTDGTDYAPFVVHAGKRIKHMPCTTPNGLAVFVEADRALWDGAGQLAGVSLARPLHSYRALTGRADGLFHSPSSLPDGTILVARRSMDGAATHAVYRLHLKSKRLELVHDDPRLHDIQAKVVAPRAEPDGRSSSVVDNDPKGKLYCLNVYATDLKDASWMPPGTAKRLRVVEGLPRKAVDENSSVRHQNGFPQLAPRRLLGEVPIAEDGSFNIEVPANTSLELQLLDEQGIALRSCGWVWTRNHYNQGCVGCHEDGELSPENWMVAALNRPSISLCPPPGQRRSMDFRRDVMPVVVAKCVPCHDNKGSSPVLAGDAKPDPHQVYRVLRGPESPAKPDAAFGEYIHPGKARTSPLAWHVFGRNTSRPWDGDLASRQAQPIPPERGISLTDAEREVLVRWIDLGAAFDGAEATASSREAQAGASGR